MGTSSAILAEESTGRKDLFQMAKLRYQKGSLILRGKRKQVWVGRWREDVPQPDGTLKRIHRKEVLGTFEDFPSKRLAMRLLDQRLVELNSFTYRPINSVTFKEFSEKWISMIVPTHKPSSQVSDRAHNAKWLVPFLGHLPMKHITPEVVQRFVGALSSLQPKSVRNVIGTLRTMMNAAKVWAYVVTNPVEDVQLPKAVRKDVECFQIEQIKIIINAAKEPLKSLLWVAAETGMRGGELCGLRVPDLDLENNIIHVKQSAWRGTLQSPKTSNGVRRFALSPQLSTHLKEYLSLHWQDNPDKILFPSKAGTPQDNSNVVRFQIHPLLKSLGLPQKGLHSFRHSSASFMDHMNISLHVRTTRLGHSDPLLTLRTYTHAISDDDRKAAELLGNHLGPVCAQVSV